MIRKSVCALVVMTVAVGVATADEFLAQITKVDGNKITYQKYEKGEKVGDAVTTEIASDTKIAEGKRDVGAKKLVAGDAIEGGLKNKVFPTAAGDKGVTVAITTDDNKAVKQILVLRNKKK
jgi:hypothetical protein